MLFRVTSSISGGSTSSVEPQSDANGALQVSGVATAVDTSGDHSKAWDTMLAQPTHAPSSAADISMISQGSVRSGRWYVQPYNHTTLSRLKPQYIKHAHRINSLELVVSIFMVYFCLYVQHVELMLVNLLIGRWNVKAVHHKIRRLNYKIKHAEDRG